MSDEVLELETRLHQAYDLWTASHKQRYPHMGVLRYHPRRYPDQRLDRPARSINRLATNPRMPETAYLKTFRFLHARAVGSTAVANKIIEDFHTQTVAVKGAPTIAEYAVECLESGKMLGINSGHIDRLTDIADFTAGLNLAVAETHGRKYIGRFLVVVNKNMTREKFYGIPIPRLISTGLGIYWGSPPGTSAREFGVPPEAEAKINSMAARQVVNDKKRGGLVLGFVPAGSGMDKLIGPDDELQKLTMKDASYTAPFMVRSDGGLLPVNRYQDSFAIGSLIATEKPAAFTKKGFERHLSDQAALALIEQAAHLTGVDCEYRPLGRLALIAAASSES